IMFSEENLPPRDHLIVHLIEAVKHLPSFAVRIQATYIIHDLTTQKEMVEQDHRIDSATLQHVEQLLLRVRLPTERCVIHAIRSTQQVTMKRMRPLMGSSEFAPEILRFLHGTIGAHENAITLHRRLPFSAEADDRRARELAVEKVGQI